MGSPRSRTPDEPGAQDIAGALNLDVVSIERICSDDAHVFRLASRRTESPGFSRWHHTGSRPSGGRSAPFRPCGARGSPRCCGSSTRRMTGQIWASSFTSRVNWQLRSRQAARWRTCGSTSALVLSNVAHWTSTRPAEIEDSFGLEQNWKLPAVLVNVAGIFTGLRPFLDIDKRHATRR